MADPPVVAALAVVADPPEAAESVVVADPPVAAALAVVADPAVVESAVVEPVAEVGEAMPGQAERIDLSPVQGPACWQRAVSRSRLPRRSELLT